MNKFPVCGQHETVPSLHGCLKPFQTRTEDIRIFPLRKVVDLKKKKILGLFITMLLNIMSFPYIPLLAGTFT